MGGGGWGSILWKNMAADHSVNPSTQDKNTNFQWEKRYTYEKRIYSQISNLAFSSQVFNSKTNI